MLSSYPTEPINIITGQDIEIPVTMVAPPWNWMYDNIQHVIVKENETELTRTGDIFMLPETTQDIVITVPSDAISSGTHILTLVTELRYEFEWYNDGNYSVTTVISECTTPISNISVE